MSADRVTIVEQKLDRLLAELTATVRPLAANEPLRPGSSLTAARARELFARLAEPQFEPVDYDEDGNLIERR